MTWSSAETPLPPGWAWTTVGQVADAHLGKMLDAKKQTGRHPMRYLRNVNVRWHHLDTADVLTMDINPDERDRFSVRAGDLVICEGGEPGRCAVVPDAATGMAFQKALHRVRPLEGVRANYLAYVLEAMAQLGYLDRYTTGSTIKHLPRERLIELPLRLPPTDEQDRTVERLDELQGAISAALRQVALVERRLAALRDATLRVFLPREGEKTLTVGELADLGSGATPSKSEPWYYEGGTVPWLTSGDLNTHLVQRARLFVTVKALEETAVKLWPAGTLLVAMYGEGQTRGRVARLAFESATNQACAAIRLRADAPVSVEFVQAFFDAAYHRNRRLGGGGVQPNLSLGVIRTIEVPVRRPEEQTQLVAEYESFRENHGLLLAQIAAVRVKLQVLKRQVLLQAWTGQLVPQRASEEPATVLLDRLRGDRERSAVQAGRRLAAGKARSARTRVLKEKVG